MEGSILSLKEGKSDGLGAASPLCPPSLPRVDLASLVTLTPPVTSGSVLSKKREKGPGKTCHHAVLQLHRVPARPHPCASVQPQCISPRVLEGPPAPCALVGLPAREGPTRLRAGCPGPLAPHHIHCSPSPSRFKHLCCVAISSPVRGDWSRAQGVVWEKAIFTNKIFVLFVEAFPSSGRHSACEELRGQKMGAEEEGQVRRWTPLPLGERHTVQGMTRGLVVLP